MIFVVDKKNIYDLIQNGNKVINVSFNAFLIAKNVIYKNRKQYYFIMKGGK